MRATCSHAECVQHRACIMRHATRRHKTNRMNGRQHPSADASVADHGTDTTCSAPYSIDKTTQCARRWANAGSSSLPARVWSGWAHIEPRSLRVLCVLRADLLLDHRLDLSTAPQRALLSTHKNSDHHPVSASVGRGSTHSTIGAPRAEAVCARSASADTVRARR